MKWIVAAALGALGAFFFWRRTRRDEIALSELVCKRAKLYGLDARVIESDQVLINKNSLFLGNLAAELRLADGPAERVETIDHYLKVAYPASSPPKPIVVVRTSEWLEQSALSKSSLNARHIVGDLFAVFAWDCGDRILVDEPKLDDPDPIRTGLAGLEDELDGYEIHVRDDVLMITCGGIYESSLLLLDIWDEIQPHVAGDILAVTPTRDLLCVTGSESVDGRAHLDQLVQRAFDEGFSYLNSRVVLRRRDGGWETEYFVPTVGLSRRTSEDSSTWTYRNSTRDTVRFWIEPWGDCVNLAPGSTLMFETKGGTCDGNRWPRVQVDAQPDGFTACANWSGMTTIVTVDGTEVY